MGISEGTVPFNDSPAPFEGRGTHQTTGRIHYIEVARSDQYAVYRAGYEAVKAETNKLAAPQPPANRPWYAVHRGRKASRF